MALTHPTPASGALASDPVRARRVAPTGTDPVDLQAASYDYVLPDALIAQTPVEPRDTARMMVVPLDGGDIVHTTVRELPGYLRSGDLLVFNNTKVFPARLLGVKPTGGSVEFLLLRPLADGRWLSMVRPGKRLRPGQRVLFGPAGELEATIEEATETGERIVRFSHDGDFWELLERIGEVPLPPYIGTKLRDKQRYNTVYAEETGSVAAPTAGLHFTPELLAALEAQGVKHAFITLHVGIGTFRPVSTENILDHPMHAETYVISPDAAALLQTQLSQPDRRIIAVGTTVVRTLESVMQRFGTLEACHGETDIFIYPGYAFQAINGLMTNFHLPQSTLLMLISSLAGRERVLQAYREAVAHEYRFFSFGDSCLFLP